MRRYLYMHTHKHIYISREKKQLLNFQSTIEFSPTPPTPPPEICSSLWKESVLSLLEKILGYNNNHRDKNRKLELIYSTLHMNKITITL